MSETHHIAGGVQAEPLPEGRVGARLRVPLSGAPSPRWSRALAAHLASDLTGHAAVGHLRLNEIVQGTDLVLEGVEEREAGPLGHCLHDAVEAANRACEQPASEPAPSPNMAQAQADAIARQVELEAMLTPTHPGAGATQPPAT